ncbi:unnamed protein product [Parnassius mnemosyne]|uniref:Uncharacterized protein n=1 Tax=Parnassius mnemosyne TaxID=213953 RepID=A0AAV1M3X2_9NEOP
MECACKWWSGHAAAVMCAAAVRVAHGDRLATGSRDHCVRLLDLQPSPTGSWEASNRRLLEPPHYDGVQALVLSGDFLYSASRDSSLKCWNLADDSLTHSVMNAHKGWVTGLCGVGGVGGASGGGRLASVGRDQALRLWSCALRAAAPPAALPDVPHALAAAPAAHALYTAGR